MAPRSLGRYALTEEIGRGAMGTVYRASDPLIERTVAVKTIDLAWLDDGSLEPRARFLREAKAAGRLNHPGIVTIHDVGEIEDAAFIGRPWMEMVLLTVVAVSPTNLRVERGPAEVKTLLDRLGAANLRYTSDDPLDGSCRAGIEIAGEITAYARIMADRNRGRIAFLCRNVGGFGTANFVVDTRTAEESIFEEFANHLLGVQSRFLQLASRSSTAAA